MGGRTESLEGLLTDVGAKVTKQPCASGIPSHHVHILEMNGDSYQLIQSKRCQRGTRSVHLPESQLEG